MNNDKLEFGQSARQALLQGATKLAKAVSATLGPKGRNVIIQTMYEHPTITKDGVTVAKSIFFSDPKENLGASIIKQAASNTNSKAGDGTTTSTILAHAILEEGNKLINAGVSPIDITRQLEAANTYVQEVLRDLSSPLSNSQDYINIATIASNNDSEIGQIVGEAVEKAGQHGAISVEDSKSPETFLSYKQGLSFENGLINPIFATDKVANKAVYEDCFVFLSSEKIRNARQALKLLELVATKGEKKPLVIIAPEFEPGALQLLTINRQQAGFDVLPIKAPSYGNNRQKMLEDIAVYTNAAIYSEATGYTLEDVTFEFFGKAERIETDRLYTTIQATPDQDNLNARLDSILKEIEQTQVQWELDQLKTRYSKLTGGVQVISVGGYTEAEVREKKDRIDDALHATRAAATTGILPGGGTSLLRASQLLGQGTEQTYGDRVLQNALMKPFLTICDNAGQNGHYHAAHILTNPNPEYGFNAKTLKYAILPEEGVIDPLAVVSTALNNAISAAIALIMTEVISFHEGEDVDYSKEPPTLSA